MTLRKISEREHIIKRPNMYIGEVDLTTSNEYVMESNKIVYKEINIVPGFIKIINEIIDNSVDVAIKSNFKSSNKISVRMFKDHVEVQDNGTGIPVIENEDGIYLPELAWVTHGLVLTLTMNTKSSLINHLNYLMDGKKDMKNH